MERTNSPANNFSDFSDFSKFSGFSDFKDPVAQALFNALCPARTFCFCFYRAKDPGDYELPEDISNFERACLARVVPISPSASSAELAPSHERALSLSGPGSARGLEMGAPK